MHRRKLKNLTKNRALPFNYEETVTDLSSRELKADELDILKNGLDFAIKPP